LYGRILYDYLVTNPNAPTGRHDWKGLRQKEAADFKHLCGYLLGQKRIDLLIQAVDMRLPTKELSRSYSEQIMRAASSLALSDFQLVKCLIRCGDAKVVLRCDFRASPFPGPQTARQFNLLSPRYQRNIKFTKAICLLQIKTNVTPQPIDFFDLELLGLVFCKETLERLILIQLL
jgi:hypothetical protein